MTIRVPLIYNGSQLQQMKTSELASIYSLAVYYYSLSPSRTLAVSGSGGNLTSINDYLPIAKVIDFVNQSIELID